MKWLANLLGLGRDEPVSQTRRAILKTAAASPLFVPILSGPRERIEAPSEKDNMLDFMGDVLVVTLLKDEVSGGSHLTMAINGDQITAPLGRQIYIKRCYAEMLLRTRRCEGVDDRPRFPMTIHHDPAGEAGKAWLESLTKAAQRWP